MGKLMFHMHIPKTGGRSLNQYLKQALPKHHFLDHFEQVPDWHSKSVEYYRNLDYLSGHIPFPRIADKLHGVLGLTMVTMVREPLGHLLSHLSWTRNLCTHPARFASAPKDIQKLSLALQDVNFSNSEKIVRLLKGLSPIATALFDNRQSRYFNDHPDEALMDGPCFEQALKISERFTFVGLFERLQQSFFRIWEMCRPDLPPVQEVPYENSLNPKIEVGDLGDDELKQLFHPFLRYDLQLYKVVKNRFWS